MSGNLTRCSRAHLGEGADFLSILKLQSSEFGMIRIEYKKWKHPGACFTFLSVKICSSESLDAKSAKIPLCGLGKATLTLIWAAARGERGVASEKKQMQCSALPQEFEMPAEFGNSIPIQGKYKHRMGCIEENQLQFMSNLKCQQDVGILKQLNIHFSMC